MPIKINCPYCSKTHPSAAEVRACSKKVHDHKGSITCGHCGSKHTSAKQVRECSKTKPGSFRTRAYEAARSLKEGDKIHHNGKTRTVVSTKPPMVHYKIGRNLIAVHASEVAILTSEKS